MTQQDVANLLGCGQGKINKIEMGAVSVKIADLRQMIEAFKVGSPEEDMMLELARSGSQRAENFVCIFKNGQHHHLCLPHLRF